MPEPLRPKPVAAVQPGSSGDRLDSWKDIAAYFGREVRTVQGWEKNEGLPIHRHQHSRQGSVYAFKSELDAWRRQRASSADGVAVLNAESEFAPSTRFWKIGLIAASAVVAIAAAFFGWRTLRAKPSGEAVSSVAVLPFVDMSPAKDQEYFSDGLTEEIIDALSRVPNLHVVARTSAFQFKGRSADIREIGRQLNVGAVMEGSVRKSGDQLRITAQLNRVSDGFHLWSRTFDRPLRDIFTVQREISQAIASQLGAGQVSERRSTNDMEAYRYYLQGRYAMSEPIEDRIKTAIASYNQALARDPNYALAYAGLADTFSYLGDLGAAPPREVLGQAKAAAQKALTIDPNIGEAHASLGIVALLFEWDWPAANREFSRALELNPGNAYDHHWYAHYLDALGRFDDAKREMRKALELDPLSEMFHFDYGEELALSRQWEPALAQYRKVLDLNRDNLYGTYGFAYVYERIGKRDESLAALGKIKPMLPENTILMPMTAPLYFRLGKLEESRRILADLKEASKKTYVSSFYVAMMYFGMNEKDQGFAYLEKAYQERASGFTFLLPSPEFDGVRSDPRYLAILKKVGIPHGLM